MWSLGCDSRGFLLGNCVIVLKHTRSRNATILRSHAGLAWGNTESPRKSHLPHQKGQPVSCLSSLPCPQLVFWDHRPIFRRYFWVTRKGCMRQLHKVSQAAVSAEAGWGHLKRTGELLSTGLRVYLDCERLWIYSSVQGRR